MLVAKHMCAICKTQHVYVCATHTCALCKHHSFCLQTTCKLFTNPTSVVCKSHVLFAKHKRVCCKSFLGCPCVNTALEADNSHTWLRKSESLGCCGHFRTVTYKTKFVTHKSTPLMDLDSERSEGIAFQEQGHHLGVVDNRPIHCTWNKSQGSTRNWAKQNSMNSLYASQEQQGTFLCSTCYDARFQTFGRTT